MPELTGVAGLRVLDVSGPEAALCGKLLADLGADVVRAEPSIGSSTRRLSPLLRRHLHGCAKIDLSRCPARHYGSPAWARRTNTVSPHPSEMKLNRHLDALEG